MSNKLIRALPRVATVAAGTLDATNIYEKNGNEPMKRFI